MDPSTEVSYNIAYLRLHPTVVITQYKISLNFEFIFNSIFLYQKIVIEGISSESRAGSVRSSIGVTASSCLPCYVEYENSIINIKFQVNFQVALFLKKRFYIIC